VLGDDALKKIAGKNFNPEARYRLQETARKLRTLKQVKARIKALRKEGEVRHLKIVLYKDSPDEHNTDYVAPLESWAGDLLGKENVGFSLSGKHAPEE
jgi:hypothetical protein